MKAKMSTGICGLYRYDCRYRVSLLSKYFYVTFGKVVPRAVGVCNCHIYVECPYVCVSQELETRPIIPTKCS